MFNSKKSLIVILLSAAFLSITAQSMAAGPNVALENAKTDINNTESLQRGAKYFVNYCMGCHSAKYVRYSRIGQDLGISDDELVNNLMFNASKPFETMNSSMSSEDALRWFGATPPDLSLIARSHSTDWLYTFLKSFYKDESRPLGSNNILLPGASMPSVFWELQGGQTPMYNEYEDADGNKVKTFSHFAKVEGEEGSLSAEEFDGVVRDLVNFLDYIGEPVKAKRITLGKWVIFYLIILFIFAYFLKKEIWKDVH